MAEEVGAAFVSLLPSARGFSRAARQALKQELRGNALSVPITPEVDQAAVTRALSQSARVDATVVVDRNQVQAALMGAAARRPLVVNADVSAAALTRETRAAIREVEATRPTVRVNVDVDRPTGGFLSRLFGRSTIEQDGRALGVQLGVSAMTGLGRATQDGVGGAIGGLANNPVVSTVGLALGLAIGAVTAPAIFGVIGAATAAATLAGAGLGLIFAGAFLLASNPVLQKAWTGFTERVGGVLTEAAQPLLQPLVKGLDIIGGAVEKVGPQLTTMFAAVAPYVPVLAEGIAGFIQAFTPGLVDAVIASGPVLEQIAWALPDLGSAIGGFLSTMATVAPQAARFIGMVLRGSADIIRILGVFIQVGAETFGFMAGGFSMLWDAVAYGIDLLAILGAVIVGDFGAAKAWLQQAVGDLIRLFKRFWDGLPAGARAAFTTLTGAARGLGGQIRSAVGSLGSLLYQAGRNVVSGLIDGIRSRFGSLADTAASLAATIRNYLPFSPAKTGPLSGSGNPFVSGQTIADMLAGGMESRLPAVASAGSSLAGAAGIGAGSRAGAGMAPAPRLAWASGASGDRLLDAIRDMIRIDYRGDVQLALGKGAS